MDGELRRKLLAELDQYVIKKQMMNEKVKIAEIIKPELERISKEHDIDMIDLFVAYMDHVAKHSKNMSSEDIGKQIDINQENIKLY